MKMCFFPAQNQLSPSNSRKANRLPAALFFNADIESFQPKSGTEVPPNQRNDVSLIVRTIWVFLARGVWVCVCVLSLVRWKVHGCDRGVFFLQSSLSMPPVSTPTLECKVFICNATNIRVSERSHFGASAHNCKHYWRGERTPLALSSRSSEETFFAARISIPLLKSRREKRKTVRWCVDNDWWGREVSRYGKSHSLYVRKMQVINDRLTSRKTLVDI